MSKKNRHKYNNNYKQNNNQNGFNNQGNSGKVESQNSQGNFNNQNNTFVQAKPVQEPVQNFTKNENKEPFGRVGEKKGLNKEQIGMIAVIAVLVLFFIFFFGADKEEKTSENTTKENNTTIIDSDTKIDPSKAIEDITSEPKEEVVDNSNIDNNALVVKQQEMQRVKDQKFDVAMDNARSAFARGDYDQSVAYYNEALSYNNTDRVYSGLFVTYSAQNNIDKARVALETAIKLNSSYTDYWIWKIQLLDEKTGVSYEDIKRVYEEGLTKASSTTLVNLVTAFARIAENNKNYGDAISAWEKAKEVYPDNVAIYQAEVDRLAKK